MPWIKFDPKNLAERSFDLRTSGLWAQHASTAPLCYQYIGWVKNCEYQWHDHFYGEKNVCQKWDSNPRPQKWTATWTQRLRPLGHPDLMIYMLTIKYQGNYSWLGKVTKNYSFYFVAFILTPSYNVGIKVEKKCSSWTDLYIKIFYLC